MKWPEYLNEAEIRRVISIFKPEKELFEIRIIGKNNGKKIISGYFTEADTLIKAFDTIDPRGCNVYITINKVNDACYSREQHDCFRITNSTTHDHEIDKYEWLFIDLDPVRIAEVSSSEGELKSATDTASKVYSYMKGLGFEEPIKALSGNGAHLLYRIDLDNTEENKNLIEQCLKALANMFNTSQVKIDEVNHNQSRICKLYGTLAQKGANTEDRPHRMSKIISAPAVLRINTRDLLEDLANEAPVVELKPRTSSREEFDLKTWMQKYGLEAIKEENAKDSICYPLANCPFDNSHTDGDSKIFHYTDGAIAFKCHHNSCRGKTWQDVRLLFEPDAYDDKFKADDQRIEAGWKAHKQYLVTKLTTDVEEVKKGLPKLTPISAEALQSKKFEERYYAVQDFIPEGETVVAAPPKTGKSWLMLSMCLAISRGETFLGFETSKSDTLYLALEDGDSFEQERLNKVLDGEPAPANFHFVFSDVMPMNEGFLLQLEDILNQLPDIKVIVIDTLNFVKYRMGKSETAYECDYRTGRDLKQFAESHNLAIVVVTHTTKISHLGDDMANVSGTNGVTGAADSVVVIGKDDRMDKEAKLFITGRKVKQSLHTIHFNDEQCVWQYVGTAEPVSKSQSDQEAREALYFESDIRTAIVKIANSIDEPFVFKASQLVESALSYGIGIIEGNKEIGGFLSSMQGMFKAIDDIEVQIIRNGTGSRTYKILPVSPLTTISDEETPFN